MATAKGNENSISICFGNGNNNNKKINADSRKGNVMDESCAVCVSLA